MELISYTEYIHKFGEQGGGREDGTAYSKQASESESASRNEAIRLYALLTVDSGRTEFRIEWGLYRTGTQDIFVTGPEKCKEEKCYKGIV